MILKNASEIQRIYKIPRYKVLRFLDLTGIGTKIKTGSRFFYCLSLEEERYMKSLKKHLDNGLTIGNSIKKMREEGEL